MTNLKVHFAAYESTFLIKLASVEERGNGSLIVAFPTSRYSEIAYDEFGLRQHVPPCDSPACLNQKYSVHYKAGNDYNTIHHTAALDDGTKHHSYIRTTAIDRGLVEPLFFRSVGTTEIRQYLKPPRKGYKVKLSAAYHPMANTLHFGLFVAPPNASVDLIAPSDHYRREVAHFRLFSVIIVLSLSDCRAVSGGFTIHCTTADRVFEVGDTKIGLGDVSPPSGGYDPIAAATVALFYLNLSDQSFRSGAMAAFTSEHNEIPDEVARAFLGGTPAPLVQPPALSQNLIEQALAEWNG